MKKRIIATAPEMRLNPMIVALAAAVLAGVLAGSLCIIKMNDADILRLTSAAESFVSKRASAPPYEVFFSSLMTVLLPFAACFALGFCAIGQPFDFALMFLRGMGLGAAVARIYSLYGAKGFVITFLMILPAAVISCSALILAARESIRFGSGFLHVLTENQITGDIRENFKLYLLKFLILSVIIILFAGVDCLFTAIFAGVLKI